MYLGVQNFDQLDKTTLLVMNSGYRDFTRKFVRIPISSFFPLEHFIKLFIGLTLYQKGATFVFGAGFSCNNTNFLVASFGSRGKTTLTLDTYNLYPNNYKYLSDDTCILYDGKLWGYPQDLRIRGKGSKFFHLEKFVNPSVIVKDSILPNFKPNYAIFLEHAKTREVSNISTQNVIAKLHSTNNKTLPFTFERHLAALDYLYGFSHNNFLLKEKLFKEIIDVPGIVIRGCRKFYLNQLVGLTSET